VSHILFLSFVHVLILIYSQPVIRLYAVPAGAFTADDDEGEAAEGFEEE